MTNVRSIPSASDLASVLDDLELGRLASERAYRLRPGIMAMDEAIDDAPRRLAGEQGGDRHGPVGRVEGFGADLRELPLRA